MNLAFVVEKGERLREIISCFAMHLLISELVCGFTVAKITDFLYTLSMFVRVVF